MTMAMTVSIAIIPQSAIINAVVFVVAMAMAVTILSVAIILLLLNILICQIPFEHQRALILVVRIIQPFWEAFHGFSLDIDIQLIVAIFPPIDCDRLAILANQP